LSGVGIFVGLASMISLLVARFQTRPQFFPSRLPCRNISKFLCCFIGTSQHYLRSSG
jgi:hypothetical protein